MKTFNTLLTLVALVFTASSFAASPQSQDFKGTRTLPALDIHLDQNSIDELDGKEKELTILYVNASKFKKNNGFFISNVIRQENFKLKNYNEPGTLKIAAENYVIEGHKSSDALITVKQPYNYILFVLHKKGNYYWVNPKTRDQDYPTPLYFNKPLNFETQLKVAKIAIKSKPGDAKVFKISIDDVENKICVSNPTSPCTAAKVKFKQIPFR